MRERRAFYLEALLLLAGLRHVEEQVEEEVRQVPVLNSILENKVLGREYQKGLEEGERKGQRVVLQKLIEQRFDCMPAWAAQQLSRLNEGDLAELTSRLFEAQTIEELFRH